MGDNDEDPVHNALRNQLILQEIFKFLPLGSLLSCSLVTKNWSYQVRTYIRDNRKCTVQISCPLPCNQLQQLNQDVGRMSIVPINSLDFHLQHHKKCSRKEQQVFRTFSRGSYENLFSKLKLKYLSIDCSDYVFACPAALAALHLMLENGNEIKFLSWGHISSFFLDHCNLAEEPLLLGFPKLQVLELAFMEHWTEKEVEDCKVLLEKTIEGCLNLNTISHNGDHRILRILPENKYRLLNNFKFDDSKKADVELAEKLLASRPTLHLLEAFLRMTPDQQIPQGSLRLLEALLKLGSGSLEELVIRGICALEPTMTFLPLENLTRLSFLDPVPSKFRSSCKQTEFGRLFPKMTEIELGFERRPITRARFHHDRPRGDLELQYSSPSHNTCKTCTKLVLRADIGELCGLPEIQNAFPELRTFEFHSLHPDFQAVPFVQVFTLWPNLVAMQVQAYQRVEIYGELRKCDAVFCGIHEDEVTLLLSMDEGFLKAVNIVPIRPCVTTMPNLESLDINVLVECSIDEPPEDFLSVVTKSLVFHRMPWLSFRRNLNYVDPSLPPPFEDHS